MAKINKQNQKKQSASKKAKEYKSPDAGIKSSLEFNENWIDRVATFITTKFGSMGFLGLCMAVFSTWIIWNLNLLPLIKPFDPYPFQMLTMIVSIFAIILSISVLISQNRERKRETIRQQVEFEVNIRAENEITKVLTMLHEIQKKLGIRSNADTELEEMKAETNIHDIHHKLDDTVKE